MISDWLKDRWALIASLAVFLSVVVLLLMEGMSRSGGIFTYVIDDPYIHMAVAKNFAQEGVWGVTGDAFTSSTSSPLWTLLLAAVYLPAGASEVAPLVLNIVFASAALIVIHVLLRRSGTRQYLVLAALTAIIFLVPLAPIVFTGMEHSLQILLVIVYLFLAPAVIINDRAGSLSRRFAWLMVLSTLLVAVRYESLFIVFTVVMLLTIRRQRLRALLLAAAALLPVASYALVSVAHGWLWLPTSVTLKSVYSFLYARPDLWRSAVFAGYDNLLANPEIGIILAAALVLFITRYGRAGDFWEQRQVMLFLFVAMTLLHLQFASFGWFFRYEAYLMTAGFVVLALALEDIIPHRIRSRESPWRSGLVLTAALLLSLVLLVPFAERARAAFRDVPASMDDVYVQMYQMGLFLERYYEGRRVAVNDIGAVSYLAEVDTLDLFGLGSLDVARMKLDGTYGVDAMDKLVRENGVEIAVMNNQWPADGEIPHGWIEAGRWEVDDFMFCDKCNVVYFYAIDPASAEELRDNLADFSPELPERVIASGVLRRLD